MAANNEKANHKSNNTPVRDPLSALRSKRESASGEATYTAVDRDMLYAVVVAVTNAGGAIRFGLTSDGGAFALGVFSNGSQEKVYVGANDDINTTLQSIGEAFSE